MPFMDRIDAGKQLAVALARRHYDKPVVLALPRGGLPVAAEIAKVLHAPLDLVLVRKIGVPYQPELAMGAVVDGATPIIVRNDDVIRFADVEATEFDSAVARELGEIERRQRLYLGNRQRIDVRGCTAIVVDDGIATGATARAALRALRLRQPAKLVLAIPVGPVDTLQRMRAEFDDIICLEQRTEFWAIGAYYGNFDQITDDEVIATLDRFSPSTRTVAKPAESIHPGAGQSHS